MTDQTARRVIELSEKATKGPWIAEPIACEGDQYYVNATIGPDDDEVVICRVSWPGDNEKQDADFIAFTRTAAPELAREYLKLREVADGLAVSIERFAEGYVDEPDIAGGHTMMEISYGEFRQCVTALAAYRAMGVEGK